MGHVRVQPCWNEQNQEIKNRRKQNFEDEANDMQLDKEDTQRNNRS